VRLSELLGLTWADIDFGRAELCVRRQMGRGGKRRSLKTAAARRHVILMAQLGSELRQLRLMSPFSGDDDLVFCTATGKTMGHRNLTVRGLERLQSERASTA
jgi:integrase